MTTSQLLASLTIVTLAGHLAPMISADEDSDTRVVLDWSNEASDSISLEVSQPGSTEVHGVEAGTAVGDEQHDQAPVVPVVPSGSRPSVPQSVHIDYGLMLPDCGVGITAATAQISCWDPATQEAFYLPPELDEAPEPDEDEEAADTPGPPAVTGAEIGAAVRAHASTQIEPAPLIIQPDQDWHLVNLPVIVRTEPATQNFSTELLGLAVDIRAEPVSYTWDFGDDTPVLNTTEPGAPYPEHTLEHTYTHSGTYQITLITYWSGSFRIQGGPWIPIDGLGITATTSPALDLQTRTTRLTG